jgi:hypothetical protein
VITKTPFRVADVAHLAGVPDDPDLVRLIATYETSSDYGIAGRPFEVTGQTDVLVATYRGTPAAETVARDLARVKERPDDEMLRIRYRFLSADCHRGSDLAPGERRTLIDLGRGHDPRGSFDLLISIDPEMSALGASFPARWAPNSYATRLVHAHEHHAARMRSVV